MSLAEVIDIRKRSIKRQIDNIIEFVTTPKGVFETVDEAVKIFREANRETLRALGIRGQIARVRGMARGIFRR